MKAVIFAAGKGNRLRPFTNSHPKALFPVAVTPLLSRVLQELPENITEIILIVHYYKEQIEEFIKIHFSNTKIIFAYQTELNGTWGALLAAKPFLDENPFLVVSADDIHTREELELFIKKPFSFGVQRKKMPKYFHSVLTDDKGIARGLTPQNENNLDQEIFVATGVYTIDRKVFDFPPIQLRDGEWGLPQTLLANNENYPLHTIETKNWYPINTLDDAHFFEKTLAKESKF